MSKVSSYSLNLNSEYMSNSEEVREEGGEKDPPPTTGKREFLFPDREAYESFKKARLIPILQKEKESESNEEEEEGRDDPVYAKTRRMLWGVGMVLGLILYYFQSTGWMLYFLAYGGLVRVVIDVQRPKDRITFKSALYLLGAFAFPLLFSGGTFWILVFYSLMAFVIHEKGGRMAVFMNDKTEGKEEQLNNWAVSTLEWLDPRFRAELQKGVPQEQVQDSMVFPFKGRFFSSDSYVHGSFEDMDIEFAEISLTITGSEHDGILTTSEEKKKKLQNLLHRHNAKDEMFRGLFIDINLRESHQCSLQVRPSSFEWTMKKRDDASAGPKESGEAWLMDYDPTKRRIDEEGNEAVYLEIGDESFDEMFKAYSHEREKARKLLSGSLKNHLLELNEQWGEALFLSLQGNRLFLALEMKDGFFNPETFSGDLKEQEEALDRFYYGLEWIHALAKELGSMGVENGPKGKES